MKIKVVILVFLILIGFSGKTIEQDGDASHKVNIEWTENLVGDFSFNEKWSYPEGVYKNRHGQLSCDGFCPIETDRMKDEFGKLYKDSLEAFYKVVDTTHLFHSLQSQNRMYEYSGTDFIDFKKLTSGIIEGKSANNVSTHSNLILKLENDSCTASVFFNSIRDLGIHNFPLESGTIKIDKALFENGIIKADFDFKFVNTLESEQELFWRGRIYSLIKTE